ncbi:MAG: YdiU family protein [Magnetococcales bacterium]|nr:YdiU family protein [Magnetococcales bacterium]
MAAQSGWSFDNSYARLPEMLFTRVNPVAVKEPRMVVLNRPLSRQLGLDLSGLDESERAALFSGTVLPEGSEPLAQAYAGHQFGHFTMLGDGRAIVLGEQITPDERRVDIQFKGSGRTPYSRSGDGKAVLGPMLREYVISEAMHALGISTTRSLAVVTTGEPVFREGMEPGAILTRVAASHLRVGTFQYVTMRGEHDVLRQLVDYALERHYPERIDQGNPAQTLLRGVMERQVDLITEWLRVGFIHGVMNTDNCSICGETIDYGPCAFMDSYDTATVFSSIDHQGRYAFGNQPAIAQWNCTRFAEALLPLLHDKQETAIEIATEILNDFSPRFEKSWLAMMRRKLGLFGVEEGDADLINGLLDWMTAQKADYTRTFRALAENEGIPETSLYQEEVFLHWHRSWQQRRERQTSERSASQACMCAANPAAIPRNHMVEEALGAAMEKSDLSPLHALLDALSAPYEDRLELVPYQQPPGPGAARYQTFCGT